MVSVYRVETNHGIWYVNPDTTSFKIDEKGISIIGPEVYLVNIQPEEIELKVLDNRDLLSSIRLTYKHLVALDKKKEKEPVPTQYDKERLTCPKCGNNDDYVDLMSKGEYHYQFHCRKCGYDVWIHNKEEEDKILKIKMKTDGELLHKYGPN